MIIHFTYQRTSSCGLLINRCLPFPLISGKWCEFDLKNKLTNVAPWKSNRGFINLLFILLLFVFADCVWKLHNVPNRILFNGNHACSCMYTREITVIDEKGNKSCRGPSSIFGAFLKSV